jgi:hypothetical protein
MTNDLLTPYRWLQKADGSPHNPLGDIYCVSFFRGLDPAEVVRRFGGGEEAGREMTFRELDEAVFEFVDETDGGDGGGYVGVVEAGGWSMAVELWGWLATLQETAARLSQGCEMVAVSRHDYASDGFLHAVDGAVVTAYDPACPFERHGSDPGRLDALMREVGIPLERPEGDAALETTSDEGYDGGLARAFALAGRITGVPMSLDLLDGPFLVGPVAESRA